MNKLPFIFFKIKLIFYWISSLTVGLSCHAQSLEVDQLKVVMEDYHESA